MEIRKKAEAKKHNERLLAEHLESGGDAETAPQVDPQSVDWLSGTATRLDTGEVIQNAEGKSLAEQEYNIEGTTLRVSSRTCSPIPCAECIVLFSPVQL